MRGSSSLSPVGIVAAANREPQQRDVPQQFADYNLRKSLESRKRRLGEWVVTEKCGPRCSMSLTLLGSWYKSVHQWYEDGDTDAEIVSKTKAQGIPRSMGAVSRHRTKHMYMRKEQIALEEAERKRAEPVEHAKVLESIIARGYENLPTARITPDLLVKAIDMHEKLTRGKRMDSALSAISDAMAEGFAGTVDEAAVESPMDAAERMAEDPNEG